MRKYFVIVVLAITNCTDPKDRKEEPAPLQEQGSFSLSKRGSGDIVNELYEDLQNKDPQLKQLEEIIEHFNEQKDDSTKQFKNFNQKNQDYYRIAELHLANMGDSLLKESIRREIKNSEAVYKRNAIGHQNILNQIAAKDINLNDLHTVLKIVRTLPVIAKYQRKNLPSIYSLSFINQKYDPLLKQLDTLADLRSNK